MSQVKQFCTFHLDGLFFGVEVSQVQEVLRYQEMTAVPLTKPVIQGLINLRGQIVTAIDLRRRLNLTPRNQDQFPMNVIVNSDDGPVSFLVDEIGDVIEVNGNDIERPPNTMNTSARSLVKGVHKLDHCLMLVLDTERAADLDHIV